jgi:hypothetical protein
MPYYLCAHCQAVRYEDETRPFVWCECGQVLDGVALLEELSQLDERLPESRFRRKIISLAERR